MELQICAYDDIVTLRRDTRNLMRSINASLPAQAHVSWLTDFIARQMLATGGQGSRMAIEDVEKNGRRGIRIYCQGDWLKGIGPFYQMHIIPALSRKDEVLFNNDTSSPEMSIISWV